MNIPVPFLWATRQREERLKWKACDVLTWTKSPFQMNARRQFVCSRPLPAYPDWTEPHVSCQVKA